MAMRMLVISSTTNLVSEAVNHRLDGQSQESVKLLLHCTTDDLSRISY